MTAASDDPVRTEVERRLTVLADAFVVRPLEGAGKLGRLFTAPCSAVASRLGQPLAVVRSVAELAVRRAAGDGGETPARADAPDVAASPASSLVTIDARQAAVDLPIDEYQSLAASHVVARLDGLTTAELERLRTFESAHRGRRTVLGKIDQLLAER